MHECSSWQVVFVLVSWFHDGEAVTVAGGGLRCHVISVLDRQTWHGNRSEEVNCLTQIERCNNRRISIFYIGATRVTQQVHSTICGLFECGTCVETLNVCGEDMLPRTKKNGRNNINVRIYVTVGRARMLRHTTTTTDITTIVYQGESPY